MFSVPRLVRLRFPRQSCGMNKAESVVRDVNASIAESEAFVARMEDGAERRGRGGVSVPTHRRANGPRSR